MSSPVDESDTVSRDERHKIEIKVVKVREYWAKASALIPNVFRLLCEIDVTSVHVLEFQDLSNKIVLVQGSSAKPVVEDEDTKDTQSRPPRDRRSSPKARSASKKGPRPKKRANW